MRRQLIVAAALGLTLVGVGGARSGSTAGGASKPRTLVSVSGQITGFAQDDDRIAWFAWSTDASECAKYVHVLTLSTGARVALPSKPGWCEKISGNPPSPVGSLALAGDRALWAVAGASNTQTQGMFVTAAVNDRVERRACGFDVESDYEHNFTLATAGDGQTLAFTMTGEPVEGGVCSGLWLVDPHGRARRTVATPATLLAVGGTRIALAQTTDYGGCVCNSGPAWSPDGTRIAFTSRRSGHNEIYLVNADGSGEHRVAQGDSPDWSPDGTKIVFARQRGEQEAAEVVVMNADGSGEHVLGAGSASRWSPNGERIAFTRSTSDETDLVVVDADGSNEVVIRNAFYDWAWSPDSGRLAFTNANAAAAIHVIRVDGTGERVVASDAERPAWSPDGTKLAFFGNLPGERYDVEVVNADGTGRHALASSDPIAVTWSPDGAKLLFAHNRALEVVAADGTGLTQLTHPDKGLLDDIAESWSPDGRMIVFERARYDQETNVFSQARIWLVNADGSVLHRLTSGNADETDPAWEPDGGRIAFARGELYVIRPDGSAERRLTATQPTEARSSAELRSAPSGRLIATAIAAGRVQAIALSQSTVALLVDGFFGRRIELFDARSTASRGTFSVPASTAPELSAVGANIVFRVRNTIYLLDGRRRTRRILVIAASTPIGLSIEGRRVAWAENVRGRGRIRAVILAGR